MQETFMFLLLIDRATEDSRVISDIFSQEV